MTASKFPPQSFQVDKRPEDGALYVVLHQTFADGDGILGTHSPVQTEEAGRKMLDLALGATYSDIFKAKCKKACGLILRYRRHTVPKFDTWEMLYRTPDINEVRQLEKITGSMSAADFFGYT